jgi:hypothetical protein
MFTELRPRQPKLIAVARAEGELKETMAQQSARRGPENQGFPQCFEHALGDMDQTRELPYRPTAA